jgi:hypothetical protein
MLGVDLGLNVGSIIVLRKKVVKDGHVFKFEREKDSLDRIAKIAERYVDELVKRCDRYNDYKIAIEEPVFSWGRKNPKAFAKLVELRALLIYQLQARAEVKIYDVNNKTAKMKAGSGKFKKKDMIEAYFKATGSYPGHKAKYGQETLADSYFVALVGYEK